MSDLPPIPDSIKEPSRRYWQGNVEYGGVEVPDDFNELLLDEPIAKWIPPNDSYKRQKIVDDYDTPNYGGGNDGGARRPGGTNSYGPSQTSYIDWLLGTGTAAVVGYRSYQNYNVPPRGFPAGQGNERMPLMGDEPLDDPFAPENYDVEQFNPDPEFELDLMDINNPYYKRYFDMKKAGLDPRADLTNEEWVNNATDKEFQYAYRQKYGKWPEEDLNDLLEEKTDPFGNALEPPSTAEGVGFAEGAAEEVAAEGVLETMAAAGVEGVVGAILDPLILIPLVGYEVYAHRAEIVSSMEFMNSSIGKSFQRNRNSAAQRNQNGRPRSKSGRM